MSEHMIKNGGYSIHIGFTTSNQPYATILNQGIKMPVKHLIFDEDEYMIGEQCDFLSQNHLIEHPVKNGKIENWELMYSVWENVLSSYSLCFKKDSQQDSTQLFFTGSINYTSKCYSKIIEHFFSHYKIQQIFFTTDTIASLYNKGRKTGLVVDSGDSFTRIVPVFEGQINPHRTWQMEEAGRSLTKRMQDQLVDNYN